MNDQMPEPATGLPRWVKVLAIVAVIAVALLVVMLLAGHGPGRHLNHGLGGIGVVQPWS